MTCFAMYRGEQGFTECRIAAPSLICKSALKASNLYLKLASTIHSCATGAQPPPIFWRLSGPRRSASSARGSLEPPKDSSLVFTCSPVEKKHGYFRIRLRKILRLKYYSALSITYNAQRLRPGLPQPVKDWRLRFYDACLVMCVPYV